MKKLILIALLFAGCGPHWDPSLAAASACLDLGASSAGTPDTVVTCHETENVWSCDASGLPIRDCDYMTDNALGETFWCCANGTP